MLIPEEHFLIYSTFFQYHEFWWCCCWQPHRCQAILLLIKILPYLFWSIIADMLCPETGNILEICNATVLEVHRMCSGWIYRIFGISVCYPKQQRQIYRNICV